MRMPVERITNIGFLAVITIFLQGAFGECLAFAWTNQKLEKPAANATADALDATKIINNYLPHAKTPNELANLVHQLGAPNFNDREKSCRQLIAAGEPAAPFLQVAEKEGNEERARRARNCLQEITRQKTLTRVSEAVREVARAKPPGSIETLLAILPFIDDPAIAEIIYYAVDAMAASDLGLPNCLRMALRDPLPARRALSAAVLARRGATGQDAVKQLLNDDDPWVRLRCAQGLLAAGSDIGIPALIGLLKDAPASCSWQAEELLTWASGHEAPQAIIGSGSEQERTECHKAWHQWWNSNKSKLDLLSQRADPRKPGIVLLTEFSRQPHKMWTRRGEIDVPAQYTCCTIGCDGVPRFRMVLSPELHEVLLLPSRDHLLIIRKNPPMLEERSLGGKVLKKVDNVALTTLVSTILPQFGLENAPEFRSLENNDLSYFFGNRKPATTAAFGELSDRHAFHFRLLIEFNGNNSPRWATQSDADFWRSEHVLKLVRFGFHSPLPAAHVSTMVDSRIVLKDLKSKHLLRRRIAASLLRNVSPDQHSLHAIALCLDDADSDIRFEGVDYINKKSQTSKDFTNRLLQLLGDKNATIRDLAVIALSPAGPEITPELHKILHDKGKPAEHRIGAYGALICWHFQEPGVLQCIQKGLNHEPDSVRAAIIGWLSYQHWNNQMSVHRRRAAHSMAALATPPLHAAILHTVAFCHDPQDPFRKLHVDILKLVCSKDKLVATNAIHYVRFADPFNQETPTALLACLNHEDQSCRLAALMALGDLRQGGRPVLRAIAKRLTTKLAGEEVVASLTTITKLKEFATPLDISAIVPLLTSNVNVNGRPLRYYATKALIDIGPVAHGIVPLITELINNNPQLESELSGTVKAIESTLPHRPR